MGKLLFLLFMPAIFCSCSKKPKIEKQLLYSTLNEIIQQDSIFARVVCSKFEEISIPANIQEEYFKEDKDFIEKQLAETRDKTIDTGQIYFYWEGKHRLEKSIIDTTCSTGILYRISYPVFSKDLQTVVVGITEDCNCMLGGWSIKAVYKRQKNKWVRVKIFDQWIS